MALKYQYQSLYGTALPPDAGGNGGYPITLGLRLRFAAKGRLVGVRAAVAEDSACEHVGMVLSTAREGVQLRTVRFHPTVITGPDTSARWHHAYFKALEVETDDELVVAVWFQNGRFWSHLGALNGAEVTRGDITAPATGDGGDNGVYQAGFSWDLQNTFGGNMYGVDALFLDDTEANRL